MVSVQPLEEIQEISFTIFLISVLAVLAVLFARSKVPRNEDLVPEGLDGIPYVISYLRLGEKQIDVIDSVISSGVHDGSHVFVRRVYQVFSPQSYRADI
jgi:hypothetical protein